MVFGKKKDEGGGDDKEEGKDDEEEKDAGKDKGGTVEMRAGDYMIHLYLEKMKELNVKEGETMDPMIQVEVLG
jgi:hypothetical protein